MHYTHILTNIILGKSDTSITFSNSLHISDMGNVKKIQWQMDNHVPQLLLQILELVTKEQATDNSLQEVQQNTSLKLVELSALFSDTKFYYDKSQTQPRPYIPPNLRQQVFQHFHKLSHLGKHATVKLVTEHFVWPNMSTDIRNWTKSCLSCQENKINKHTKSPTGTFSTSDAKFRNIHVDIVGPLPCSQGYTYISS